MLTLAKSLSMNVATLNTYVLIYGFAYVYRFIHKQQNSVLGEVKRVGCDHLNLIGPNIRILYVYGLQ